MFYTLLCTESSCGLSRRVRLSPSATGAGDIAVVLQGAALCRLQPTHQRPWFKVEDVPGFKEFTVAARDMGVA
jgi:hypothetical protein